MSPEYPKVAGYNLEHLSEACEYLWELGKNDKRKLNQTPDHGIRILSELCEVEPNKPHEFNKRVIDFGLSLLDEEESWTCEYSPFDILNGILKTEGHTTESNGRQILLNRFSVNIHFVSDLRCKVIDAAIGLLSNPNVNIALQAARFLRDGVHYPIGGEAREEWTKEFVRTLEKIESAVQSKNLDDIVLIEIANSISWHTNYASDATSVIAKRIVNLLPGSIAFRTKLAFIDGYGRIFEGKDFHRSDRKWNKYLDELTKDLVSAFPEGEDLRAFLEKILLETEKIGISTSFILYRKLIQASIALARAIVQNALIEQNSKTTRFAGIALGSLLNEEYVEAVKVATRFVETDSRDLFLALGEAYSSLESEHLKYSEKDVSILEKVFSSKDEWVLRNAVYAVRKVAKSDRKLAIDLLKKIDIGISNNVVDEVLMLFQEDEVIPFRFLSEEDIKHFLNKLMSLEEIEGYWVETFLAKVSRDHAIHAAAFFMARVERAAKTESWEYRPCNYGPYSNVPLLFRQSPQFGSLLRVVAQWMRDREEDYMFQHRAGVLFDVMFRPYDAELIRFLQNWIDKAVPADINVISHILRESGPDFVFQNKEFVMLFTEKAKQFGKEYLTTARSALFGAAISGVRKGIPGEPLPEDIRMKTEAEKAMNEIPRFSAAYKFYEDLKKHAEQGIERSLRDQESFDE